MKAIRQIGLIVGKIMINVLLLSITFILSGTEAGAILFILILIGFCVLFILSLAGLIKGQSRLLKMTSRTRLFSLLLSTFITSVLLILTFSAGYYIGEELDLTPSDKITRLHRAFFSNEDDILAFTQDYPQLEADHIVFRYHPDTETAVTDMIVLMEAVEELEKEIYGQTIEKVEPLEVLVLKDSNDYFTLNRDYQSADKGLYDSRYKRAMIHQGDNIDSDNFYITEIFIHEYSHYLFDLYLEQEELNKHEVPVWYDEGIAEFMSNRILSARYLPGEESFELSFLDLHTHTGWDRAMATDPVYHQAFMGVEYIVGSGGHASILSEILLKQKEVDKFSDAFAETTGVELAGFNEELTMMTQDLATARNTWAIEKDFDKAQALYGEILDRVPSHSQVWFDYALMNEENLDWEPALTARRELVKVAPNASSFIDLSYLLVLTDAQEALEMAAEALRYAEWQPYGDLAFFEEWVEEVDLYQQLMSEANRVEAYDTLIHGEHLLYMPGIINELDNMKRALVNQPL